MRNFREIASGKEKFVIYGPTGNWVLTENSEWKTDNELLSYLKTPQKKESENRLDLLVLNSSPLCNLSCVYCFASEVEDYMGMDVIDSSVSSIKEHGKGGNVIFHGREPLTRFGFLKQAIEKHGDRGVQFAVQSNLTLLSQEMAKFFHENNVGVSTSLDGLEKTNDLTRKKPNGGGTYQDIENGMRILAEYQGNNSVNLVVNKHNVRQLPEILKNLDRRVDIGKLQFSLYIPPDGNDGLGLLPDNKNLLESMKDCITYSIESFEKRVPKMKFSNLSSILSQFFRSKEKTACTQCGTDGNKQPLLAVDTDGSVYPCDLFWGEKELKIGDIKEDSLEKLLSSEKNFRNTYDIDSIEECSSCEWKMLCLGGCPGEAYYSSGNVHEKSPYCEYHSGILEFMAGKISELNEKNLIGQILTQSSGKKPKTQD